MRKKSDLPFYALNKGYVLSTKTFCLTTDLTRKLKVFLTWRLF